MENIQWLEELEAIEAYVWGWPTISLLLGLGAYLMIGLRFMPLRRIGTGFRELLRGRSSSEDGEIPPFRSLMTAMSATVGAGNIVGVATAITYGGPGAIFWMWVMALLGMATKYSEAVLAVHYREETSHGEYHGGPMYYIQKGLGENWTWLALLFAIFATVAAFGIGNMVQSHSVADGLHSQFGIDTNYTGIVMAVLIGLVIFGGLKRIAAVAARLVPLMTIAYVTCAMVIILYNIADVPAALQTIVVSAFTGHAAVGGIAGVAIAEAIHYGIARGIFSNEAGLGSAAIAHASAQTSSPVRQGQIAMLGTFIDTLIICTMTALVIILSGVWMEDTGGAALSTAAFNHSLGDTGGTIVAIALAVFAFTTILGWNFYGERCIQFFMGRWVLLPYRALWIVALFVGSTMKLDILWVLSSSLNILMAWPNLVGMLLLSTVVFRLTQEHDSN